MNIQLRTNYTSKDFSVGTIFDTLSSGKCTVIGKPTYDPKRNLIAVRFNETGTEVIVATGELRRGEVKDRNCKNIYDVACIGYGEYQAKWRGKMTKEYVLWFNILSRCYDETTRHLNPTYAEVTMCDMWLNFQDFCADIPSLDGYTKWANNPTSFSIDKDVKHTTGNKTYSPDTCIFISRRENSRFTNIQRQSTPFIAHRIVDGHEEEWLVKTDFCKHYNLPTIKINDVIKGKRKSSHGWTFRNKIPTL